ncbi:MAG: hypothetical protein ABW005_01865 [Burkholderiaceae bacterium]
MLSLNRSSLLGVLMLALPAWTVAADKAAPLVNPAGVASVAGTASMGAPAPAKAASCDARGSVGELKSQSFSQAFSTSPSLCGSLASVLKRLFSRSAGAGRKLEGDKPLNLVTARREYQAAQADPAFSAELKSLTADEADPIRRAALEAALLDEQGYYEARDLLLRELSQKLGL